MRKHLFRFGFILGLILIAVTAIPIFSQDNTIDLANLPLGDGKITFDKPEPGSVFSCVTQFNGGGAFKDGSWIRSDGTWDRTAKTVTVDGAVNWPSELTFSLEGDTRVVTGNSLPDHPTGVYPVAITDDAYNYDRNPNSIQAIDFRLELPANPQIAETASCLPMGAVGIMLSGSVYFNGLDAAGRDAAAHEIQDNCGGHPESNGQYHYHDLSNCLESSSNGQHSELMGYALDGFGIYGHYGENGETLTDADLDECHGHTHLIEWDGQMVEMYHYHATWEYPYIVGCFRGTPIDSGMSQGGAGRQRPGGQQPPTNNTGGQQQQPPTGNTGGQQQPPAGGAGGQLPPPPGSGG